MQKYFNIAGPCNQKEHYMLSPIERNPAVMPLIDLKQYFVIHAARQSGKTTLIRALTEEINKKGDYYALYCSLETLQNYKDPAEGIPKIIAQLKMALLFEEIEVKKVFDEIPPDTDESTLIYYAIAKFTQALGKPFILFFDEVDCLQNGTLINFLRQLRNGFVNRNKIPFAHSIALVGMRDIRDYKAKIRDNSDTLGSASPFNIVTKSLTIGNFTLDEVRKLIQQHIEHTDQKVDQAAIDKVHYYSQGQPWLTNALMREVVMEQLSNDFSIAITSEHIDEAAQTIMMRRDTHLDSLLERLKEERVRNVIESVLTGKLDYSVSDDDTQYCIDLGIIENKPGELVPSNPIYKEVIIRTLTQDSQHQLTSFIKPGWLNEDQTIDMNGLMAAFQEFWRENSDIWIEKYQYKEAAPHLIMQAFLQRVINGGGTIDREYATGRRRMDLCVHYHGNRYAIELKLRYNEKTIAEGLQQLSDYLDTLNLTEGWLLVFDRRPEVDWDEKIFRRKEKVNKKTIFVVGC